MLRFLLIISVRWCVGFMDCMATFERWDWFYSLFFSGGSEIFERRCSVSISGCVWVPGLVFMLCPDCRKHINMHHFRKPRTSLQKKSKAFCTPSVSCIPTWTGTELFIIILFHVKYWLEFERFSGLLTWRSSSSFIPVWRTWSKQKSCSTLLRLTRLIITPLQRGWTTFLHWSSQRSVRLLCHFIQWMGISTGVSLGYDEFLDQTKGEVFVHTGEGA